MEDIKVGEYVKTKKGFIGKLTDIDIKNDAYYLDCGKCVSSVNIVNHSFNKLELIQAGDYVNGHKVYESDDGLVIFNIDDFEYFVNPMGLDLDKYRVVLEWQDENYIKNIVTKEQFDGEKYIVGG